MVLPVFAATKVPRDGGPNGAARHDNLWFTSATIKQSPDIQVPVVPLLSLSLFAFLLAVFSNVFEYRGCSLHCCSQK